jgi:hypothetical protein
MDRDTVGTAVCETAVQLSVLIAYRYDEYCYVWNSIEIVGT